MSDTLLESLAFFVYHWILIKAIVHNIASIVITTISSTKVNHFNVLFCIDDNYVLKFKIYMFMVTTKAKYFY